MVADEQGFLVWNNYTTRPTGVAPDFVLSIPQGSPRDHMMSSAVDDRGRLWIMNQNWQFIVYQLPLHPGQVPSAEDVSMYWADNLKPVSLNGPGSVAFDPVDNEMYFDDESGNRILRISNYDQNIHNATNMMVDRVIGQTSKNDTACNGGGSPSASSLCIPHQIKFDGSGDMFVLENEYECQGNDRIVEYSANDLRSGSGLFPKIAASHVLIAQSLNGTGPCATVGLPGSPVSIAIDSENELVVGEDGYYGNEGESQRTPDEAEMQRQYMQLWLYRSPLSNSTPSATIRLPMGSAGDLDFDSHDNLIAQDHTWNRLWVVNLKTDPGLLGPT